MPTPTACSIIFDEDSETAARAPRWHTSARRRAGLRAARALRGPLARAAAAAARARRCRLRAARFEPLLPPDHDRAGDGDRRVCAEDNAYQERDGEAAQHLATEEHEREHGEEDEARSDDRARERLVDRVVRDVVEVRAAVHAKVLAYAVEDDDGVVDGEADER